MNVRTIGVAAGFFLITLSYPALAEHEHSQKSNPAAAEDMSADMEDTARTDDPMDVDVGLECVSELMSIAETVRDPEQRRTALAEHSEAMLEEIHLMLAQSKPMAMKMQRGANGKASPTFRCSRMRASAPAADQPRSDASKEKGGMKGMEGMKGMGGGMMKMHRDMSKRVERIEQMLEQIIRHQRAQDVRDQQ